jgi:hypothetical protein
MQGRFVSNATSSNDGTVHQPGEVLADASAALKQGVSGLP